MATKQWILLGLLGGILSAGNADAAITASQVLVVHNSQAPGAATVLSAYLSAHPDIPAANVFDLNDASIAGTADVSYADFIARIRNPIRAYIDLAGNPTPSGIISIVLIKGIPHRIQDTDNAAVGDNPSSCGTEFTGGDYSAASVDSELTLLWQNLESGESGGGMDSKSDNIIDNPYHQSTSSIATFTRSDTNIKNTKSFTNTSGVAWALAGAGKNRLTAGDIYLVSRIDANTTDDAVAMIQRAQSIRINRRYAWVVLDEHLESDANRHYDNHALFDPPDPLNSYAGNDYNETAANLRSTGWNVIHDMTTTFILPAALPWPIAAYASYGENHINNPPGTGTYLQGFRFARGAIFNTAESYNARALNGLATLFGQEQVADFITLGGTFGVGNVWEPFSFSLPDNEFLFLNFLVNGGTWAEAAWSAMPFLSWMQVVIGDPLATATIVDQPADFDADGDVDGDDGLYLISCITGTDMGPPTLPCTNADLDGDDDIDQADFGRFQRCLSGPNTPADPLCDN